MFQPFKATTNPRNSKILQATMQQAKLDQAAKIANQARTDRYLSAGGDIGQGLYGEYKDEKSPIGAYLRKMTSGDLDNTDFNLTGVPAAYDEKDIRADPLMQAPDGLSATAPDSNLIGGPAEYGEKDIRADPLLRWTPEGVPAKENPLPPPPDALDTMQEPPLVPGEGQELFDTSLREDINNAVKINEMGGDKSTYFGETPDTTLPPFEAGMDGGGPLPEVDPTQAFNPTELGTEAAADAATEVGQNAIMEAGTAAAEEGANKVAETLAEKSGGSLPGIGAVVKLAQGDVTGAAAKAALGLLPPPFNLLAFAV